MLTRSVDAGRHARFLSPSRSFAKLVVSNAALALLCHVAADGPLLIVGNLQWADRASERVVLNTLDPPAGI